MNNKIISLEEKKSIPLTKELDVKKKRTRCKEKMN